MAAYIRLTELEKVGLICSNCGSELIIELLKADPDKLQNCHTCPACHPKDETGKLIAAQPPFSYASNWIRDITGLKGRAEAIRLYFKDRR